MSVAILARYGRIAEVAEFDCPLSPPPPRDALVVVQSHRGQELARVLNVVRPGSNGAAAAHEAVVLRLAAPGDIAQGERLQQGADASFARWLQRIAEWKIDLELIDLEWMLDEKKLVLYVLAARGPESTKLALHAAAAGLGTIEVQPVGPEGLLPALQESGGGCGSGGCGCH